MADTEGLRDRIASNRAAFAAEAARLRADQRLTAHAKRQDIRAAHARAEREHQRLRAEYDAAVAEDRAHLERSAFGTPKGSPLESDDSKANRRRLHAQALAQAEAAVGKPDALRRMMAAAHLAEDESLAVAVAHVASRTAARDVVADFAKRYPARAASIARLSEHIREHDTPEGRFRANIALTPPTLPGDVK